MIVHPEYRDHPAARLERQRTPFAQAIADPALLKRPWQKLSWQQQTVLKIFYGLPLTTSKELEFWSATQGFGIYDELGYLTGVTKMVPYEPKEYDTLTGILGRRSGKSDRIAGFSAAYEITLGGHTGLHPETGVPLVRTDDEGKVQDVFWLYIAQDLSTAKTNLKFILSTLRDSPILSKMIVPKKGGGDGDEEVKISNGIIIRAEPPNIRTSRGVPVIGVTMDEVGFWYKDAKSANPDFEVVVALTYAMGQFPNAKQLRFSTPWTKEGVLFEAHEAGTEGHKLHCDHCADGWDCTHVDPEDREKMEGHLVVYAPTASMGNPILTRKFFARARKRDLEKFKRESLALFIDALTTFLTWSSVEKAIDKKQTEREPLPDVDYIAVIDPAFRRDSFVLTVLHNEKARGIVQDYVREWVPEPGTRLNPGVVLSEVKLVLDRWGVSFAFTDQHHLDSLMVIAEERDFALVGIILGPQNKSRIMHTMASRFNMNTIRLLDNPTQEQQLKHLQRIAGPGGYENVAAPGNQHDDFATALAMGVSEAVKMIPAETPFVNPERQTAKTQFIPDDELARLRERFDTRMQEDDAFRESVEHMQDMWRLYGDGT